MQTRSSGCLFRKKQIHFIQAFGDFVHQVNGKVDAHDFERMSASELQKIGQWLNDICSERIQSSGVEFSIIDLKPEGASAETSNQPGSTSMGAREMVDKIDRLLNAGHFVSYTHSYHAVTIVGRTEDCRFIIQDSIPQSTWNAIGGLLKSGDVYEDSLGAQSDLAQISFENQFFQYWPRAILLKNVQRIEYVKSRDR